MDTVYRFDVQVDFKRELSFAELSLIIKDQNWINFDYMEWGDFNDSSRIKQWKKD